ncbi:MAG: L,D-transpeptidase family protein [Pseudomonadota bacterium]
MPQIHIDLARQWLELRDHGRVLLAAPVSTAAAGLGEQMGSYRTPRGRHRVRARIGADAPVGAVFVGRRWTGEVYSPQLAAAHPGRDWILTRILWLCGCEVGFNRLGAVDTQRRYIYIHGTPDSTELGVPGSKGCVRMGNVDLLRLFDLTPPGTPVDLVE